MQSRFWSQDLLSRDDSIYDRSLATHSRCFRSIGKGANFLGLSRNQSSMLYLCNPLEYCGSNCEFCRYYRNGGVSDRKMVHWQFSAQLQTTDPYEYPYEVGTPFRFLRRKGPSSKRGPNRTSDQAEIGVSKSLYPITNFETSGKNWVVLVASRFAIRSSWGLPFLDNNKETRNMGPEARAFHFP